MSSATCFSLDQSKILSSGNGLNRTFIFNRLENIVEKGEHSGYHHFPGCYSVFKSQSFSNRQILDSSKFKEFADNNCKSDENGGKFSKRVEKEKLLVRSSFLKTVFKRLVLQTH